MSEPLAGRLQRRLIELPLSVEKAHVALDAIELPSYPDEPRPSSTIALAGGQQTGTGENVAWSRDDHHNFQRQIDTGDYTHRGSLGSFLRAIGAIVPDAYQRAAIESAAVDLALRQARTNLEELAASDFSDTRYVRSFAASPDPLPELVAHREQNPEIEIKLDVHPAWEEETLERLANLRNISVLDFKHQGTPATQTAVAEALPAPWLEDPGQLGERPSGILARRFSLDAALTSGNPEDMLRRMNPAAVNLKVPRMGGVLALLRAAAFCEVEKRPFYFGGMFEVSVGRAQARELASLLAPGGPNDLAPIPREANHEFPPSLRPPHGGIGFGHR
jgi:L-alanine-DL-glutamate epimerase-like enolase superfamily enzyme